MIEGLNDGAKAKSELPSVKCLCKKAIALDNIIEHAKLCSHVKLVFGTLPETIDNSLRSAKDIESYKVLRHLFTYAKERCKEKIRGPKVVPPDPVLVRMPEPVPVRVPESDLAPVRIPEPDPEPVHAHEPEPMERDPLKDVEEEKHVCQMMEQSGVHCGVCKTWFLDFNQIMYLAVCLHTFCKEDLKNAIFRYGAFS